MKTFGIVIGAAHHLGRAFNPGFFIELKRFLDIVKPPPARQCEQLPGGWGIVIDDLVAGIYGNLLIRAGLYCFEWWPGYY